MPVTLYPLRQSHTQPLYCLPQECWSALSELMRSNPTTRKKNSLSHIFLPQGSVNDEGSVDEDSFFELLTKFQSKRMDDQRCRLSQPSATAVQPNNILFENDDGAPPPRVNGTLLAPPPLS